MASMRVPPFLVLALAVSGCSQPVMRASFEDATPAERTLAAANAARDRDEASIPHLIAMLDSEDPAQRMVAGDALERITGETQGFFFADPEPKRREAIGRWREWYLQNARRPIAGS